MCISQILVKFHNTAVCFITHTHGLATGACVGSLCGNSEVVYVHIYVCVRIRRRQAVYGPIRRAMSL